MKIKTRKFLKTGLIASPDYKWTGEEVTWKNVKDKDDYFKRFNRSLGFLNYYLDRDDFIPIIAEYMKNNGWPKAKVDMIKFIPKSTANVSTIGKLCRMFNMGMEDSYKKYDTRDLKSEIKRGINVFISDAHTNKSESSNKKESTKKPKVNVHAIMQQKVRENVLTELELMLDEWTYNEKANVRKINLTSILRGENIPVANLGQIKEWIEGKKSEYVAAFEKTCPDLVEGYSYLSKPALRKRISLLDDLLNDIILYKASKASARKPRAKKTKSASKQIERLNYLNESKEYGVQSADPTRLIGANMLYIFNTKYRRLTVLKARTRDGFTCSGSTVKDFDAENSFALTLRKPKDVLPIIVAKTERQIAKALDNLKTKRTIAKGRINKDTLILRTL